jgi:putative ABC transport system substrate-binding protein
VLAALGGASGTWAVLARAQQKTTPVIGFLGNVPSNPSDTVAGVFQKGLRESGYIEGQNVQIEYRWVEGQYDRLAALAAEFVERKVDVIVSTVGRTGALAAKGATSTIPIVFFTGDDPVESGLVRSLARPDGNLTGVSVLAVQLTAKQLELLSELIPEARAVGLLVNPANVNAELVMRDAQQAARVKRMRHYIVKASTDKDIDAAFTALAEVHADALIVSTDPAFYGYRNQLTALAAHHAIPAIYERREFVAAGGLISYGADLSMALRQLGLYTGQILKGAKPADLPVVLPTKYELVVNLKAAKALGLTIPPSILGRADEVIE